MCRMVVPKFQMGGFPNIRGTIFGSTNVKDYRIMGFIAGPPYLGKLPNPTPDGGCGGGGGSIGSGGSGPFRPH